jgi:lipoprotein-releasing system permease protein
MFQPLSVFVGLRYVRARGKKFFVSFITLVSLLGVCLGVAALIVILSVMNGFEGELRDRLLALTAHARITSQGPVDWPSVAAVARSAPGVTGVAPYAEVHALAVRTPEMLPVQLRGIDPRAESAVSDLEDDLLEGRLEDLGPGTDRIILGSIVAQLLGVTSGDAVTLLIPSIAASGAPEPRLREFTVAGVFEIGLQDHDGVLALANIEDVRAVAPANAVGLRLHFEDALQAPAIASRVAGRLPPDVTLRDWTQEHASYFRAIRIEKTMMALILLLIVAVAAFNIVAMLVMVVTDKRSDIAILRTFGASPRRVMGVFVTQGLVIGWLGVVLGVALGVALTLNVDPIVTFLERTFGFQIMDADVYYITRIPADLQWLNVGWIGGAALVLTALATLYPALRAARVPPAEALRYE